MFLKFSIELKSHGLIESWVSYIDGTPNFNIRYTAKRTENQYQFITRYSFNVWGETRLVS